MGRRAAAQLRQQAKGQLRLLRDTTRISKPAFVEVDLEGVVAGGLYTVAVLWRRLHRTRLPDGADAVAGCWLERWSWSPRGPPPAGSA